MLLPSAIRRRLAEYERGSKGRGLYHRTMGELIDFRLTFDRAPVFRVIEDVSAGTVTATFDGVDRALVVHLAQFDKPAVRDLVQA